MKNFAHKVRSHQNRNMETKKECIYTTRRFHLKMMITLKQKNDNIPNNVSKNA